VVDVAPGNGQEDPNAKYLAESSNKVSKQTRAKDQTPNYRNAMPKRTSPTPQNGTGQETAKVSGNEGAGTDERPQKRGGAHGAMEIPTTKKRQELALRMDPRIKGPGPSITNRTESEDVQGNSSRLNLKPGQVGPQSEDSSPGRAGPRGPINLNPSASVLDRIAGGAPNDHLDVEEGDGTFLNTREWKYASFFNRVKQSVGMHWDPGTALRQRDPSGEIYGGRDRYTVLHVVLDARGSLRDVQVEKSSGLDFLDQEAMASFRRAQPFPNPPPGLLAQDSMVTFSFGFFLELGGSGARMRLFRGSYQ
jgi:TonB family protein